MRPGATGPDVAPLVAGVSKDIETVLEAVQVADAAAAASVQPAPEVIASAGGVAPDTSINPKRRPQDVVLASAGTASAAPAIAKPRVQEVVTRVSTSGGRHWGINVGRFPSRYAAEKILLKTALMETSTLDGSLRKVVNRSSGYDANFMGLSRETADLACRRLQARQVTCFMIGPS